MVKQMALWKKKFEKVAITMAKNTPFLTLYRWYGCSERTG